MNEEAIHRFADPEYTEGIDAISHYASLLHVGETSQGVLEANANANANAGYHRSRMASRKQVWAMRHLAKRMGISEQELVELAIRLKRVHPSQSGGMLEYLTSPEIGGMFEIKQAYEDLK